MTIPITLATNIDTTYADDSADPSRKIHQQAHDAIHTLFNATVVDDGAGHGQVAAVVAVVHGSTGSKTRPSTTAMVQWIGSATPANAVTNDEWTDTTNNLRKRYTGTTWQALGSGAATSFDGGSASSVYVAAQAIDGGTAA